MYHGHRRVSFYTKYQVSLLTTIDDKEIQTGESEGLNRVKNFAFISGLVSLAKDRIVSSTGEHDFDLSSEPYPLVMDAPFSNADETHTSNISRILPEVAEQVIMFVMQKDWRYAEPVMASHVRRRYSLIKHSEQFSEIKEAN
jgi:DNA sulfur modification protein DndD